MRNHRAMTIVGILSVAACVPLLGDFTVAGDAARDGGATDRDTPDEDDGSRPRDAARDSEVLTDGDVTSDPPILGIAAGARSTCVVLRDHTAKCWGSMEVGNRCASRAWAGA